MEASTLAERNLAGPRPYAKGMLVGRFQPFHLGHLEATKYALSMCDRLVVCIGSSQTSGTLHNPMDAGTRIEIIRAALDAAGVARERIEFLEVPDFGSDSTWINYIRNRHSDIEVVFSENEWVQRIFNSEGIEVRVPPLLRRAELSGTAIRNMILEGRPWQHLLPRGSVQIVEGQVQNIADALRRSTGKNDLISDEGEAQRYFEGRIESYLGSVAPAILGGNCSSISSIRYVGAGTRHFNYLADTGAGAFLFRFSLKKDPEEHTEYEHTALKLISGLGFAPKSLAKETRNSFFGIPFLVVEFVRGKSPTELTPELITGTAELMARLHSVDISNGMAAALEKRISEDEIFNPMAEKLAYVTAKRAEYQRDPGFTDAIVSAYGALRACGIPKVESQSIGHCDINRSNMVLTKDGVQLIDWETAAIVPPAYDIAAFFDRETLSERERELFLSRYLEVRKDKSLRESLDAMVKIRTFDRMLWCLWEAYDVQEGARGGKFPLWRTPELYIEDARRRFGACKELGVIPEDVEWDPPLVLEMSVSK
ncbi:MAG: nicotinamide-nucleotide adenylyltransferase [Candidatus Micrarchaeales archaeon]|nr:nicotinamide-nucleotide adenylyltransferase [Candidatus Micrarchaeales archaeon]